MKPRFRTSPVAVSDAVDSAWRTHSMLYDAPDEAARFALEAYLLRLVIKGERNQDQLTLKALIYLKKREDRTSLIKSRNAG